MWCILILYVLHYKYYSYIAVQMIIVVGAVMVCLMGGLGAGGAVLYCLRQGKKSRDLERLTLGEKWQWHCCMIPPH